MDPLSQGGGDRPSAAEATEGSGDVEERLVQRDPLDRRRDLAQDGVELGAHLPVASVPGGDEHGLGAQPAGGGRGHGRADPEGPGLVGGGCHHPSAPGSTDHHWPTPQGGVVTHLDGHEEGIHVDVDDRARAGGRWLDGGAGHDVGGCRS